MEFFDTWDFARTIEALVFLLSARGALLVANNDGRGFEGHILFTVSNVLLIGYFAWMGKWFFVANYAVFLYTSVKGLWCHRPKRNVVAG
jgi:hypothetical protein